MDNPAMVRAEVMRARDFIGWEVRDRAGEKVGTVGDLLLDRDGRVRFVHVEYGLPRKHFVMPVAEVEWGEGVFVLGGWTREQVKAFPPYEPERPLDAPRLEEMERAFPWLYGGAEEWRDVPPGEVRIVPLADAREFRLESGALDPRGWNVFGADGERLGTVAQLLVDPAARKVRYLDVDLLDDLFVLRDDRHVLLPLEHVELKERGKDVWVQGLAAAEVARFPAYGGGPVHPALERRVAAPFTP